MNVSLRSALVLGLVIGCSHSGADLFDDVGLPPLGAGGGGTGSTSTAGSTGAMEPSSQGGSSSQGGKVSGGEGGTSTAGKPPAQSDGGEPMSPEGEAGAPTGTAGMPDQPDPPDAPECDNGKLEAGEECDDAGHAGQDGCEKCKVVCTHFGAGTLKSTDHHCYGGYDEANFEAAQAACKERGAHLVTISSAAENQVVRNLVNSSKLIGGFEDVALNQEGDGDYEWLTGEALSYENWAAGEPNQEESRCGDSGPGPGNTTQRCYQHCMAMNGQGRWEDHRCDLADGYVCEWEPAGE